MSFFEKILKFNNEKNIGLLNMTDEFFALYVKKLFESNDQGILIVTPSLYEANKIYSSVNNYVSSFLFQDDELFMKKMVKSNELLTERLDILNNLIMNGKQIVVTDTAGYLKYLPIHLQIYLDLPEELLRK